VTSNHYGEQTGSEQNHYNGTYIHPRWKLKSLCCVAARSGDSGSSSCRTNGFKLSSINYHSGSAISASFSFAGGHTLETHSKLLSAEIGHCIQVLTSGCFLLLHPDEPIQVQRTPWSINGPPSKSVDRHPGPEDHVMFKQVGR